MKVTPRFIRVGAIAGLALLCGCSEVLTVSLHGPEGWAVTMDLTIRSTGHPDEAWSIDQDLKMSVHYQAVSTLPDGSTVAKGTITGLELKSRSAKPGQEASKVEFAWRRGDDPQIITPDEFTWTRTLRDCIDGGIVLTIAPSGWVRSDSALFSIFEMPCPFPGVLACLPAAFPAAKVRAGDEWVVEEGAVSMRCKLDHHEGPIAVVTSRFTVSRTGILCGAASTGTATLWIDVSAGKPLRAEVTAVCVRSSGMSAEGEYVRSEIAIKCALQGGRR